MPEPHEPSACASLLLLESVATEVLTLIEGLDEGELLGSRFTLREVRSRVLAMAQSARDLRPELCASLPEIDWEAWRTSLERIQRGGAAEGPALWFAAACLTPTTLSWLRLYRHQRPELFSDLS
jgi:hypothetical protein